MRNLKFPLVTILFLSILIALSACSAIKTDEPALKEGRCRHNSDCKEGFTCRDTFCDDIHFPRADIKPY